MASELEWVSGPPPDEHRGLVLVVLDPALFGPGHADPWDEYYGDPVCVRWWGHKGKTTFGARRVNPDDVLRHALLSDPHDPPPG